VIPLLVLAGFVVGSIPFGVLISRRLGVDIRIKGSGNIGATNVARVLGLGPGILVLVLDAGKGALVAYLAQRICGWPSVVFATGFAAMLGHCFSPFLGGHGGKGVATALGVLAFVAPMYAVIAVGVFMMVAGRTRIPALGSLSGAAAATIVAFSTHAPPELRVFATATLVLLVYTHRGNLARLVTTRQ
jgi:glycerol-3-phosphate acyltransferase PlsY